MDILEKIEMAVKENDNLYKSILKHYANWYDNKPSSDERKTEKK